MASKKITDLTEATSLDNANDWLVAVDVSDTSQSASGTNKKIKPSNLGVGGASPLTTKGDLYGYDTADARLPVGTNGQILEADSSTTTGLKWSNPNPVPYGIIYENDNFIDATDFTAFGDASAVAIGGKLQVTSVTNGSFDQYLALNTTTTGLGKFKITMEFELPNAPAATTFGIGTGIRSVNTYVPLSMAARMVLTNSAQQGDRYFDYTNTHPGAYTNAINDLVGMAVSQNDTVQMVLEQDLDEVTITYWNKTTDVKNILNYTYTLPSPPFPSNTGQFVIHCIGGTYDVTYFKVESKEWKNSKLLCLGDSKLNGFTGDSFEQSIPQQLEGFYRGIHDNTGGNDRTVDVLLKIQEIIDFEPKKVLLNIGSNDKREGRTLLQWQTDYDDIVTQLETAGIDVYHLLQFNESVLTFTDYNSHITGTYSASRIVDPREVSLDVSGIHPDQTGMDQAFMAIISAIGDEII